jgi:hypothetical protein
MNKPLQPTIFLLIFLVGLIPAFAQSRYFNKTLNDTVNVVSQPDTPLIITPTKIENNYPDDLLVRFDIQNISGKKIKAYTISRNLTGEKDVRGHLTFFSPLDPGELTSGFDHEIISVLKDERKIIFSVKFVLFEDGTFWGGDSIPQLEFFNGYFDGQKKMFSRLQLLIDQKNEAALTTLMTQDINKFDVPDMDKSRSEKWHNGFDAGYRVTLNELRPFYQKQGSNLLPLTPKDFNSLITPIAVIH